MSLLLLLLLLSFYHYYIYFFLLLLSSYLPVVFWGRPWKAQGLEIWLWILRGRRRPGSGAIGRWSHLHSKPACSLTHTGPIKMRCYLEHINICEYVLITRWKIIQRSFQVALPPKKHPVTQGLLIFIICFLLCCPNLTTLTYETMAFQTIHQSDG